MQRLIIKGQIFNVKLKVFALFLLLAIIYQLSAIKTFAAEKNTITVLPQLTQLDLNHDLPETEIFYTNSSTIPVELALSLEDVRELEDRNPVGLLDPKEAGNYKYSLSSWAYLSSQTLLLNPGETGSVKVSITKDKLSPGGHYGSVLAEIHQSNGDKKNVKVKGVLVSLLFVRASTGSQIEEAKIADFASNEMTITFPEKFAFHFQNTGNVDLTPYGLLELKNSGGKTIAKGIVNEDSLITLPEAIRKYDVSAKPLGGLILPGKYTATLSLHFGKSNKKLTVTTTFISGGSAELINWAIIVLIAGVILTTVIVLIRRKLQAKL